MTSQRLYTREALLFMRYTDCITMKTAFVSKVTGFVAAGVAIILVAIPFHALLTVWAASIFGHYTLLRLWKELLLILLLVVSVWLVFKRQSLRQEIRKSWLFKLMLAYVLLQALLGLAAYARHDVNRAALGE